MNRTDVRATVDETYIKVSCGKLSQWATALKFDALNGKTEDALELISKMETKLDFLKEVIEGQN